jgi:hypothetical protein
LLNPDYRDMLSALSAAGVEYLLVGAFALAAHGLPRATGDIDVWVRPSPENALRVIKALQEFGAPAFNLTIEDLSTLDLEFQIGVAPRRVDILTSIDGIDFDHAWPNRVIVELEGVVVPVISRADLITNKRASGRPKDRADLAWLESGES